MAGFLSPATREQIRAASDIVDVIGSYIPLKKAGANFVALCPFLTDYAQEARMYSLVALLGIATLGFFLNAYLRGRRGFRIPFGIALALLIYTHNWGLFLGVSMAVCIAIMWTALPAGGPERSRLLKDALLGKG